MVEMHKLQIWRLGVACCGLLLAFQCASAVTPPSLTVPMPPPLAQQAVLRAVGQISPQSEEHRRYRMALPYGAPLFPPDADLANPPLSATLSGWLALPAAQRRHDVLLTPDIDHYWPAEGRQFSCQFILHLEADGGGTRLTVLQVRPTEYAGKRFELLGRTGPGRYMQLRPTAPSAQAEAELRSFLSAALARQQ